MIESHSQRGYRSLEYSYKSVHAPLLTPTHRGLFCPNWRARFYTKAPLITNTGAHYLKIRYSAAGPLLFFGIFVFFLYPEKYGGSKTVLKSEIGLVDHIQKK